MSGKVAGIGPVITNREDVLERAQYSSTQPVPKNEVEIFLSLCTGRVIYRELNSSLYFVDSPALSVTDIISGVFKGLGERPQIRQLYMDKHGVIKAAFSIKLNERQKKMLMVALQLNGINIKQQLRASENRATSKN